MDVGDVLQLQYIVAALVYSAVGVAVFFVSFLLLDLLTPKVSVWRELVEKQNLAFGVFLAGATLGIAIIIASAIH
ncbi:hypothetical protein ANOBCDAF_00432 [Pleomorphomonas sp. T1.2MG-36]|uniref:DUF350 domain-containing protein n=1 Tax=Pleomorphomonas sp. T1.2MG-36 TaxID=3041167 RepID=UPI0024779425|nr:DUF350 domain-containing protein [Pleomorphomonas sp. T1.2MG-36]CAI9400177.1 hypothetical protein ANOBCDAF_00432 [Pleomorphomonas sp. T1.2MG-36]